jgi:hypothetical protein
MIRDISLTEDDEMSGSLLAHRLDCPVVQDHRARGRPIMTLIDLQRPLSPDVKRHECLAGE